MRWLTGIKTSSRRKWSIKIRGSLFLPTTTNIIVSRSPICQRSLLTALRTDAGHAGVNHVAYTYANLGDLLATYERLKQIWVTPYWRIHHGITLSLYYQDPDGNRMEFQVDCGTVEEANAYMQTDAFAANPAGVEIDPETLLHSTAAGCRSNNFW
jgi:catechol-2,3-dioxygenase